MLLSLSPVISLTGDKEASSQIQFGSIVLEIFSIHDKSSACFRLDLSRRTNDRVQFL